MVQDPEEMKKGNELSLKLGASYSKHMEVREVKYYRSPLYWLAHTKNVEAVTWGENAGR